MTLSPGDKAPHFSLPASTGETISLSGAAGRKVVLCYVPLLSALCGGAGGASA